MAILNRGPRVGRSQGALMFWGLVSVFFAAAFCYYFWENSENRRKANNLRDEVMTLQTECDSLTAEKAKMEGSVTEAEKELSTHEEFLKDKETKLAAEETRLEALGTQTQNLSDQSQAQAAVVKKFDDTVRKLVKGEDTDVVLRGGRPVLRVPASVFFGYGDATLKPSGKALLTQIAQSLDGQLDNFELRMECYTDSGGEVQKNADTPPLKPEDKPSKSDTKPTTPDVEPPARYATGWELTAARAAMLAHYLRDSTSLPFGNVVITARGDSQPIVADANEGHARNRRIEITITPVPASFHPSEAPSALAKPPDNSKPKGDAKPPEKSDVKPKGDAKPADKTDNPKPKTDNKTPAKTDSDKAKGDNAKTKPDPGAKASGKAVPVSKPTTNAPSAKAPK